MRVTDYARQSHLGIAKPVAVANRRRMAAQRGTRHFIVTGTVSTSRWRPASILSPQSSTSQAKFRSSVHDGPRADRSDGCGWRPGSARRQSVVRPAAAVAVG